MGVNVELLEVTGRYTHNVKVITFVRRAMGTLCCGLVGWLLMAGAGCSPTDLGTCRIEDARTVAFDSSGNPAFVGQALVQQSCGNGGLCHSRGISPSLRKGVPHGLDFDMIGSRTSNFNDPDPEALDRIDNGRDLSFEHREAIYETVESGEMPPGEVGEQSVLELGYATADGEAIPVLDSSEGRRALRNWLACGSPVVERTGDPTSAQPAGSDCGEGGVGLCVVRSDAGNSVTPLEATWTSIYDNVFVSQCVGCHSPGALDFREESQLDLQTKDIAYGDMVDVVGTGQDCEQEATVRVIPGDADGSLLVHKLENVVPGGGEVCGDVMPTGGMLSSQQIATIRAWIDAGAAND